MNNLTIPEAIWRGFLFGSIMVLSIKVAHLGQHVPAYQAGDKRLQNQINEDYENNIWSIREIMYTLEYGLGIEAGYDGNGNTMPNDYPPLFRKKPNAK